MALASSREHTIGLLHDHLPVSKSHLCHHLLNTSPCSLSLRHPRSPPNRSPHVYFLSFEPDSMCRPTRGGVSKTHLGRCLCLGEGVSRLLSRGDTFISVQQESRETPLPLSCCTPPPRVQPSFCSRSGWIQPENMLYLVPTRCAHSLLLFFKTWNELSTLKTQKSVGALVGWAGMPHRGRREPGTAPLERGGTCPCLPCHALILASLHLFISTHLC